MFQVLWILFFLPEFLHIPTPDALKVHSYPPTDTQSLDPGFPITRLYLVIQEELPPGTTIIDLSSHPVLKNLLTSNLQTADGFQYRLMNTFDSHLFRISPSSGQLSLATRLDREALCASQKAQFCCNIRAQIPTTLLSEVSWKPVENVPKSQLCHLVAHISLQPNKDHLQSKELIDQQNLAQSSRLELIYLYIRLDDINDHTPQFATPVTSLNVPEDTPVGNLLHYFRIFDPDAGSYGLHEVKLTAVPLSSGNLQSSQQISSNSRGDTSSLVTTHPFEARLSRDGVSLILLSPLDRETIPAYDVTLTATDGDKLKPKSSQLSLRLLVTDVNDNSPMWVQQRRREESDNLESDEIILPNEPATTQFNVSMPEDTPIGSMIYWLQARDFDTGDNARLQYAIDTSAPGGLTALDYFSVQTTTGEVRLRTQLDYDTTSAEATGPEIEVPVIVRDSPRVGRQLSARATLYVHILDVNDIHPVIVASPLSPMPLRKPFQTQLSSVHPTAFGIWENQAPGQPVASILVSDPDTGDGGKVSCSVNHEFFKLAGESIKTDRFPTYPSSDYQDITAMNGIVGPTTYQLISVQKLDREQIPRHQVLLTCRDHDRVRPLVSTRRLDIEVIDENDNAPQFEDSPVVLVCQENAPPGQIIGRINATDKDVGENARLRFRIDDVNSNWVSVHSHTGEVRVNTVFDREIETERQFLVFVSDGTGSTAHTTSTQVRVRILDENDHAPHFTDLYFFSIPENSPPGTEVGRVSAEDEDSGENGKIHYLLRQPSKEFDLDKVTGKITVRSPRHDNSLGLAGSDFGSSLISALDREQQDAYELTVIAEDGGDPPRRSTTVVHIGLSDLNDHAPQFRYPTPHGPGSVLNVSCAQLSSQVIARVHANDSDSGRNGEIEYSIVRSSQLMSTRTKRETATIKNSSVPQEKFNRIHANNIEDNSKQGNDKNLQDLPKDNATNNLSLSMDHDLSTTRHVKSAPVNDPLIGGPTVNHFEINSYNGQLFLIHPILDCSQSAEVRLLIKAQDGGMPPRSSTALLTIHVYPTEQNSLFLPERRMLALDGTQNHDVAFTNKQLHNSNSWDGKSNSMDKRLQRKPTSVSIDPATQLFSGSSHWSAIIGLVIAMVVLVLLLCLMLVILRRRFLVEDQKIVNKREPGLNRTCEKGHPVGTAVKLIDGGRSGIYYKSGQVAQSIHDLNAGSPHQRSLSPATLTQVDDLNCSSVTLELSPPMVNTHYFCTMPPHSSSNTMTLNTGELAMLRCEGRPVQAGGDVRAIDSAIGFNSPGQVLYKTANGDLYGYVDPHLRNHLNRRGQHTYQTLQPNQHTQQEHGMTTEKRRTSQRNTDCFRRNMLVNGNQPCHIKNAGPYTPLLEITTNCFEKDAAAKLFQASQPDLSHDSVEESTRTSCQHTERETSDMGHLLGCDRAFSLTDLTPQKIELLPEMRLQSTTLRPQITDTTANRYMQTVISPTLSTFKAYGPSSYLRKTKSQKMATPKTTTVEMEQQSSNSSFGEHNHSNHTASFV
ncbi:hypothetical protein P879_03338 [Paragonimus westermani]|uniref:Cadherin domain-containing protein n=1 Tax=Paragonimus westermani TaxID=34504 RepID=A0A8T0DKX7_9TREM|nr:hypothetical protein P879_03338 [Paragonimus westermani]